MTGTITLRYDADDRYQRAEAAAIVRGDGERLRGVLRALDERLRRAAQFDDREIPADVADALRDWLTDELDGLPLSLED